MTRHTLLPRAVALAVSSGCLLCVATPSSAHPISVASGVGSDEIRASVQSDDLNLGVPAGRRTLDRRIAAAVRMVCEPGLNSTERFAYLDCLARARQSAQPQVAVLMARAQMLASRGGSQLADASQAMPSR